MPGTAVEQVKAQDLQARQVLNRTLATADILAASSLLRADLRGKPEDVRAIALTLHQYGLPVGIQNLNACYVVKGRVEFETRMWTALAMSYGGHRVWLDEGNSAEQATAWIERADSGARYCATFTMDDARRAGLAESETYRKYPQDMLGWRALSRVIKRYAPEVIAGLADAGEQTVERPRPRPLPTDQPPADDDIADAEIVEQGEDPGPIGHATREDQCATTAGAAADAASHGRDEATTTGAGDAGATSSRPPAGPDSAPTSPSSGATAHSHDEQPEVYDNRRRRANAVMGEVGVKTDDARHQLVHTATGGATESTGRLTAWQVEAIVAFCDRLNAEADASIAGAGDNGPESAVVDSGTAPEPPRPVAGEWRARAAKQGMSDNRLLLLAREVAEALGVDKPRGLADVTDEVGAGVLERLG